MKPLSVKQSQSAIEHFRGWFSPPGSKKTQSAKTSASSTGYTQIPNLPQRKRKTPLNFAAALLRTGAEIEHSLLVQYLYAAYSINEQTTLPDSGLDDPTVALNWKTNLRLVAREEMAHLVTVQNLLLVLNQPFHLNRAHIHGLTKNQTLPFALEPLTLASIGKYVIIESPWNDQQSCHVKEVMKRVRSVVKKKYHSPLLRVGLIYATLYWLFMRSDNPGPDWPFPCEWVDSFRKSYPGFHLKNRDFVSRKIYDAYAASGDELGVYETNCHADRGSPREAALGSLRWIMAQGEGPNAIEKSHFYRFLDMFEQFEKLGTQARRMIFNVPCNPVVNSSPKVAGTTPILDKSSRSWGKLLNVRYQLLLLDELQFLSSSRRDESDARRMYAAWALKEMKYVQQIGQLLPHKQLGRKVFGKKGVAAAPFQLTFLPAGIVAKRNLSGIVSQRDFRRKLLSVSGELVAEHNSALNARAREPVAALERGLLLEIGRHDDEMTRNSV